MLYCQLLDNDIKCVAQTGPLPVFLSMIFENQNIAFQLARYQFTIGGIDTLFNLPHKFEMCLPRCVNPMTNLLCNIHTVKQNYISISTIVGIQLHWVQLRRSYQK